MPYIKEDPTAPGSPIRPEDNQNIDQLIPKLNFFYYGDRSTIDGIDKQGGICTPAHMLKKYPNQADEIKKVYGCCLDNEIKANSVMAFLSRIPTDLPNTKVYNKLNVPVRISVAKLLKAKNPYKAYIFNVPGKGDKMFELTMDQVDKLTKMEDRWYHQFRTSKDPYFRDVTQVAIYCASTGRVPSFSCKILRDV